jgi:cytochrome P450
MTTLTATGSATDRGFLVEDPSNKSPNVKTYVDNVDSPSIVTRVFTSTLGETQLISYLKGHPNPKWGERISDYDDYGIQEERNTHVERMQKDNKVHCTARKKFINDEKPRIVYQTADPQLQAMISSFPRYSDSLAKIPQPIDSKLWKLELGALGIVLSVLNFGIEGTKLFDRSVINHLRKVPIPPCIDAIDEKFLQMWSNEHNELRDAHDAFSLVNWYLCARFVVGIPEEKFKDYSQIWSHLFHPQKDQGKAALQAQILDQELRPYFLEQIRHRETLQSSSLLRMWLDDGLADKILDTLTKEEIAKAEECAKKQGMTLHEKCLVDMLTGLHLAMLDTVAYTMTEFLFQLQQQPELKQRALKSDKDFSEVLEEVMRQFPASGNTRQLSFDTEIITSDNQHYEFKKEAFISVHAGYTRNAEHPPIFSSGAHACPGKTFALHWLQGVLKHIITKYEWCMDAPGQTDLTQVKHLVVFNTRHNPPLRVSFEKRT